MPEPHRLIINHQFYSLDTNTLISLWVTFIPAMPTWALHFLPVQLYLAVKYMGREQVLESGCYKQAKGRELLSAPQGARIPWYLQSFIFESPDVLLGAFWSQS